MTNGKFKTILGKTFVYLGLIVYAIWILAPMLIILFTSFKTISEVEEEFKDSNYGNFKKQVADVVVEEISKIQNRYNEYINSDIIDIILEEGKKKTRIYAEAKLNAVKNKIGFYN